MQDQLLNADIATRKAYLRLFVERIEVDARRNPPVRPQGRT